MTDKAADWALPIIGTIIKGEGNPPTTIPALTAKFKEAFADPDAKRAAARKIAALTQTTTTSEYVKELLSTKDNIPDNDLEAIFAASVKIDNIRRENEENRPKKAPPRPWSPRPLPPLPPPNGSASLRTLIMSHRRKDRRRASGLCVKCGQKGHGSNNVPMDGKPPSRKPPRWEK
ncbi:hypothetical protein RHS01_10279 [Rhizoctonia solani]|uniref:Retrotransposon gag domain-containing protein n=1 Tax=Rhizoctonia solani TaxID=456999 RepID=A0A8H7M086_9AGAM|nr:hypothetical protein RHS01_10279 [Rhizoctonia solani]